MGTSGTDQEEFCLRWNDFESSISSAFRNLRNDPDFCDVRLAVKDRSRPLKAHKVVLSSCSPYFSSLLREMNAEQQNSLSPFYIMMRGVTHSQLSGILDFMYYGEANVAQEDLDQFLALAEELQVKGLTSKNGSGGGEKPTSYTPSTPAAKKRHTPAAPEAATPSAAAATPSKRARQSSPAPKASIKTEEVTEDAFEDDNFDDAEADDAYGGGEEEAFDDEQEDPGEGTSASGGAGGSGAGYNDDDKGQQTPEETDSSPEQLPNEGQIRLEVQALIERLMKNRTEPSQTDVIAQDLIAKLTSPLPLKLKCSHCRKTYKSQKWLSIHFAKVHATDENSNKT